MGGQGDSSPEVMLLWISHGLHVHLILLYLIHVLSSCSIPL